MATATLEHPKLISTGCCGGAASPTISEHKADEYAGWFKALADPTRIRILNMLVQSDEPLCVCEIVEQFPLGQSAISHHLKILRDVRFVVPERRGTFMYYSVNCACLSEFPESVRAILNR